MRRFPFLLLGIVLLLGACGTDDSDGAQPRSPDYTPRPDTELFTAIAQLPGIQEVDVSYNDTWPENGYVGEVTIAGDVDAQATLDRVYAVLRQGRPRASITVGGVQDGTSVRFELLGGRAGTPVALDKRYGPQPGDGTPPTG